MFHLSFTHVGVFFDLGVVKSDEDDLESVSAVSGALTPTGEDEIRVTI